MLYDCFKCLMASLWWFSRVGKYSSLFHQKILRCSLLSEFPCALRRSDWSLVILYEVINFIFDIVFDAKSHLSHLGSFHLRGCSASLRLLIAIKVYAGVAFDWAQLPRCTSELWVCWSHHLLRLKLPRDHRTQISTSPRFRANSLEFVCGDGHIEISCLDLDKSE